MREHYGENLGADLKQIRHADLKLIGESVYRAACPVCSDGILLVARDPTTLRLSRYDRCICCLQAVFYMDEVIGGEPIPQGPVPPGALPQA